MHVQVGTLSKAIGVLGGYVCGSRDLIEFLYHRARPFLFSTSHPPAVTASCIAALDVLESEPQWMERLWANTRFFKGGAMTSTATSSTNAGLSRRPEHSEGTVARTIEQQTAKLPSDIFLWAAGGAIAGILSLAVLLSVKLVDAPR